MRLGAAVAMQENLPRPAPTAAQDLALGGAQVTPETTSAEVMAMFDADAALQGVVVAESGRPVGLINRNGFYAQFARPYHRDLFLRKACTRFMDPAPITVEAEASISEIGATVAEGGDKGLSEGVVVTREGRFQGLCDGVTLLRALADLQSEQHRLLLSSIDYASTIQTALMADSRAALARAFGADHALVWQPRDVVGGDCFFAREDEAGVLIGLIDCTGHGVPGALLTSIAISETSRLAASADLRRRPAELLQGLNQRMKAALQQDGPGAPGAADDGMDAAFLWIDADRRGARLASARLPLFLVTADGSVEAVKGGRKGLGYRDTPADCTWPEQALVPTAGLRAFLATDGVADQLGEASPMAFGWKRFSQALSAARAGGVAGQAEAAWAAFGAWQGRQARRDDVTIIGAQIGAAVDQG
jgi:sigma-B regulation protein RsbU (phosphoserine phosphatase)